MKKLILLLLPCIVTATDRTGPRAASENGD